MLVSRAAPIPSASTDGKLYVKIESGLWTLCPVVSFTEPTSVFSLSESFASRHAFHWTAVGYALIPTYQISIALV